jgi:hypothetical protein
VSAVEVWRAEWSNDPQHFDVHAFVIGDRERAGARSLVWILRDVSEAKHHAAERERCASAAAERDDATARMHLRRRPIPTASASDGLRSAESVAQFR